MQFDLRDESSLLDIIYHSVKITLTTEADSSIHTVLELRVSDFASWLFLCNSVCLVQVEKTEIMVIQACSFISVCVPNVPTFSLGQYNTHRRGSMTLRP